jgi:hypothetical protein
MDNTDDILVEFIYERMGYEDAKEYFQSLVDSDGWDGENCPLEILDILHLNKV